MKSVMRSKKFVAYLVAEIGWKILIACVLLQYSGSIEHYSFTRLMTIVITSGFIQVGYILGQAALDRYTAIAEKTIEIKDKK